MKQNNRFHHDVDLKSLVDIADITGMVTSAVSYALEDMQDEDDVTITQN